MSEAVGRGYYESGADAGRRLPERLSARPAADAPRARSSTACRRWRIAPSRSCRGSGRRLAGRTAELERLAVEMYARGLSTRDIEAAFRDASGASLLSRTAVSQVTERLWQEYEAFADPGSERVRGRLPLRRWGRRAAARRDAARGGALCWGITEDGRKVLLHLAPGHEGGHGELHGVLRGPQAPGAGRSAARRHRRGARASSAPSRPASRARCASGASPIGCGTCGARCPRASGPRSRSAPAACYEAASPALAAVLRDDFVPVYERELPARRRSASSTTSRPASRTCASRCAIAR